MTEVDRLKVVYEVNDAQFRAGMERMRRQGDQTGDALVRQAARSETAFRRLGNGNIQNVAFQLGDFATQVGAGTSASVALGQQLPQLLGGFGALGAVLGAVVAVGVPLAAAFLNMGGTAADLDKTVKSLTSSVDAYREAAERAGTPTDELVAKYGAATGAAQQLLAQLAQIAKVEAAESLRANGQAIAETFDGLIERVAQFDAVAGTDLGGNLSTSLEIAKGRLSAFTDEFGLSIEQAQELSSILSDQASAQNVEQQADAMRRLAEFLNNAAAEANYTNAALNETAKAASEGALSGFELATALESAEIAAGGVIDTVAQLPGTIDAATASAINLTRALSAAIQVAQSRPGAIALDLGRFGNGEDITRRAGGLDLQEQQEFRYNWLANMDAPRKAAGKAGGRGRGGGSGGGSGGRARREERPLFEDIEKNITALQRELELVGKSNEEIATAKARWELLDEAKKRGLNTNGELNAQIDTQAAAVGRLTAELEAAEIAQGQFDQAIDGIADAMAGALVAGESLREGLAQVFKGIASDLIRSGLRRMLMGLIPGFGGDALTAALRGAGLPASFDGGGYTGMGARTGGIDGKGGFPAILHPNETVIDHTRGQGMGAQSVNVTVSVDQNGNLQAFVDDRANGAAQRMGVQINKALPARVQQINANPRRR